MLFGVFLEEQSRQIIECHCCEQALVITGFVKDQFATCTAIALRILCTLAPVLIHRGVAVDDYSHDYYAVTPASADIEVDWAHD